MEAGQNKRISTNHAQKHRSTLKQLDTECKRKLCKRRKEGKKKEGRSEEGKKGETQSFYVQRYAAAKLLQSCPTLCNPIDGSPPEAPRPWDSPGKNTGVGCHFLLHMQRYKTGLLNEFFVVIGCELITFS